MSLITRATRLPRPRLTVLGVLVAVALSACSLGSDARTRAAEALAGELATSLTARQLGDLPLVGGGQEQLDAILAGVADTPATVTVDSVEVDGDAATVSLVWAWETRGESWRYATKAELERAGDAWTVQWAPSAVEPSLAAGESLVAMTVQARRGDILGAGDVPLVTLRPVVRFGIDKVAAPAGKAADSARALAGLLGVDKAAYAKQVRAAGPKAFVEALVLREADAAEIDQAQLDAIPGAVRLSGELPLAPSRDFGAGILGQVGPATADIVKASDGAVRPGDEVGLSGLQARYDEQLGGTPGVQVVARGSDQERTLFAAEPVAGQSLRTTLDKDLQSKAEAALRDIGPASAVVALRPSTGDIVAAANGAGSDGYNTATFGQYAPGSTMKLVTALALMRAGVQPDDVVPCTRTVVVNGKPFANYDDYPTSRMGDIPLTSAVANSCNTAIISQHERLTGDDLTQAAAALGLGVDRDLGFPAYFGQVPEPASETEKAADMIGQGKVLASPMAMAAVAASVAAGQAVVPRLLPDQAVTGPAPERPLTQEEADALREMMRTVVTRGTATFLGDVPGPPVGAKTGTAEFGTEQPPSTHAWMIATQGDLAVAVFVEQGQSGSQTAGPILEEFLRGALP
jgi:cell division protein FtsI/penicillin-binding protein 2